MKTKLVLIQPTALLLLLSTLSYQLTTWAQGTTFTYQGRLNNNGAPADGSYDLQFTLFDATTGGSQVGVVLTNSAVWITNGLFALPLDFGAGVFTGNPRALEIGARTNGAANFITLLPRQPLTATPYALYAASGNPGPPGPPGPAFVTSNSPGPLIAATNTGAGPGLQGSAADRSVVGISTSGNIGALGGQSSGVYGFGFSGSSVYGTNAYGHAVRGDSGGNIAVLGINGGASSEVGGNGGVYGLSGSGFGIGGESTSGDGVLGSSQSGYAGHFYGKVRASGLISSDAGVQATNAYGHAVRGDSGGNIAVLGINGGASSDVGGNGGVYGLSGSGFGIGGESTSGDGVLGSSQSGYAGHFYGKVRASGLISSDTGVQATNAYGHAVRGDSGGNIAVLGINGGASSDVGGNGGVYGLSGSGFGIGGESTSGDGVLGSSQSGYAGHFYGRLNATGVISGTGGLDIRVTKNTGNYNDPVAYFENLNNAANSSPALRVVASGNAAQGALSVSTQGTGLIARFGNAATWVAALDASGNWSATSFNPSSDRNLKENFKPVDPRVVLDKVAALPILEWNFKTDSAVRHVGPMAQDFYAAFSTGTDDKHIATVDADGVALAAIQGLNAKVEVGSQKSEARNRTIEERLQQKETEITELKQRLEALEKLVRNQKSN